MKPQDLPFVDMLRDARANVREYFGADLWEADINWDHPAQLHGDQWTATDAKVSHAIGFICGVAAALDVTPMSLLDEYREAMDADCPSPRVFSKAKGPTKPRRSRKG